MRAFVTGGSGFVGSHLVDRLLGDGHQVTVYDLKMPVRLNTGLRWVAGNLMDTAALSHTMARHDMVFHLAANADVRFGAIHPRLDLEQNLLGTANVLDAMRETGTKRIMFSSTSVVYGEPNVFPTPEDCPFPIQTSLYGASKVAAEAIISAYALNFGLQAVIFRFVPMLGERYAHGHVWDFWKKLQGDPTHIEVLGDGQQRKSYVYIGDSINAIMLGTANPTFAVQIYNVGSDDETVTVDQNLTWICEELGLNPKRTYTGSPRGWIGDPPRILLDCSKIRGLGWKPKVPIREAVRRTVRSFQ